MIPNLEKAKHFKNIQIGKHYLPDLYVMPDGQFIYRVNSQLDPKTKEQIDMYLAQEWFIDPPEEIKS